MENNLIESLGPEARCFCGFTPPDHPCNKVLECEKKKSKQSKPAKAKKKRKQITLDFDELKTMYDRQDKLKDMANHFEINISTLIVKINSLLADGKLKRRPSIKRRVIQLPEQDFIEEYNSKTTHFKLANRFGVSQSKIKSTITELVKQGKIAYRQKNKRG